MASVTPLPDGPLKIEGASLMNEDGTPAGNDGPLFLCRCGQSKNKPFCDASHKAAGFKS